MFYRRCLACLVALVAFTAVAADDAADAALIGSWDLVKLENHASDGQVSKQFGDAPIGRITCTADGHMSAQILRAGRPPFADHDLYGGTPAEKRAAYDSFIAYYGSFEVDSANHVVTHHVVGSLFPNWVGGDQQRYYAISGDELTLSTKPFTVAGKETTARVLWKRAH